MPKHPPSNKITHGKAYGVRIKNDVLWKRRHVTKKVLECLKEGGGKYGAYSRTEKDLNIHRAAIRYWFLKSLDPTFHNKGAGGSRKSTFELWETAVVREYVIEFFKAFPSTSIKELALFLTVCLRYTFVHSV